MGSVSGRAEKEDVVVTTTTGDIRGTKEYDEKTGRSVIGFYGIPFAAPPTGNNRFRPPQPPKKWAGILDCTAKKIFQVCSRCSTAKSRAVRVCWCSPLRNAL